MTRTTATALLLIIVATGGCAETRVAPAAGVATVTNQPVVRHTSRPDRTLRRQQECIALAMYWEARGESRRGIEAVGWTILNRVASPHFPSTPCAVVFEGGERPGCQFSWYCDGKSDRPSDRQSWQRSMIVAGDLLTRPGTDPTRGALFFHATSIATPWRRPRVRTAQIGGHVFYR